MNLLQQFSMRCHFSAVTSDGKIAVCVKSMNVGIFDLEKGCLIDTLNVKFCGYAVFSADDKLFVLKNH